MLAKKPFATPSSLASAFREPKFTHFTIYTPSSKQALSVTFWMIIFGVCVCEFMKNGESEMHHFGNCLMCLNSTPYRFLPVNGTRSSESDS